MKIVFHCRNISNNASLRGLTDIKEGRTIMPYLSYLFQPVYEIFLQNHCIFCLYLCINDVLLTYLIAHI